MKAAKTAPPVNFRAVERRIECSAHIAVENEIWRSICRGEIAGKPRSEKMLANELNVPRVLLRAAVDNLIEVGLLVRLPGQGIRLSDSALRCVSRGRKTKTKSSLLMGM